MVVAVKIDGEKGKRGREREINARLVSADVFYSHGPESFSILFYSVLVSICFPQLGQGRANGSEKEDEKKKAGAKAKGGCRTVSAYVCVGGVGVFK